MTALEILNSLNEESAIQYHAYSLLHDKIAELEAENARLQDIMGLAAIVPTREQIAALVKGLKWAVNGRADGVVGVYGVGMAANSKLYAVFDNNLDCSTWHSELVCDTSEARAAAEAHHRETVLSLLNI